MPKGKERVTSIRRGDKAGTNDTARFLAATESMYVATLGLPKVSGRWKQVKRLKDRTTPCPSGGSWIKKKVGWRELDTTF